MTVHVAPSSMASSSAVVVTNLRRAYGKRVVIETGHRQPEVAAQSERGRFGIEEAVGTGLDLKVLVVLGPDGAAEAGSLFENFDIRGGSDVLESVGERQTRDTTSNDNNCRHRGDENPNTRLAPVRRTAAHLS